MFEQSLKQKIVSASKWSALAELSSKVISPLVLVILARILTPEDYGIVSVAAIVISFSQIFWDVGLSKALIQREDNIEKAANVVFWTNIFLGFVLYILLFFLSGFLAGIFKEPRVAVVIQVLGIQLILSSFGSVQTAIYQRDLNFRALFWVRFITATIPAFISIPMAMIGYGYWALVGGTLIGSAAQLIVLYKLSPWRPSFEYEVNVAKQLFSFGFWVTGEGLLGWFYIWVDSLVVGAFLGTEYLGLYQTGNNFVMVVYSLLLSPLLPILYSSFSRIQRDYEQFRNLLVKTIKIISLVSLPMGIWFLMLGAPIERVFFGGKWYGIGQVISLMGLSHGLAWLVGINGEAYRAVGRPDLNVKIMLLGVFYYLPAYIIAVPYGLHAFLLTRLAMVCITIPIHLYVAKKYLNSNIKGLLYNLRWIFISSIILLVTTLTLNNIILNYCDYAKILILTLFGGLIYVFSLLPERFFIKNIISSVSISNK